MLRNRKVVFLSVVLILLLAVSYSLNRENDTRRLKHIASYDPLIQIDVPIKGSAKTIVEILESKNEVIVVDETLVILGGLWIVIEATDKSQVFYNLLGNKMKVTEMDSDGNVINSKWCRLLDYDHENVRNLIHSLLTVAEE